MKPACSLRSGGLSPVRGRAASCTPSPSIPLLTAQRDARHLLHGHPSPTLPPPPITLCKWGTPTIPKQIFENLIQAICSHRGMLPARSLLSPRPRSIPPTLSLVTERSVDPTHALSCHCERPSLARGNLLFRDPHRRRSPPRSLLSPRPRSTPPTLSLVIASAVDSTHALSCHCERPSLARGNLLFSIIANPLFLNILPATLLFRIFCRHFVRKIQKTKQRLPGGGCPFRNDARPTRAAVSYWFL